jgi:hypothetical protein
MDRKRGNRWFSRIETPEGKCCKKTQQENASKKMPARKCQQENASKRMPARMRWFVHRLLFPSCEV